MWTLNSSDWACGGVTSPGNSAGSGAHTAASPSTTTTPTGSLGTETEHEFSLLRKGLLAITGLGIVGILSELIFLRHWEEPLQLVALAAAVVLGVALGWVSAATVFLGLFLAFLLGSVIGILLIATGRRGRRDHVPFGPFLALGTVLALLLGEPLLALVGR